LPAGRSDQFLFLLAKNKRIAIRKICVKRQFEVSDVAGVIATLPRERAKLSAPKFQRTVDVRHGRAKELAE
jgi:hypothetical protein